MILDVSHSDNDAMQPEYITLDSPLDMHVHFRQGSMCKLAAPWTAKMFSGALVMPNTTPFIDADNLQAYRDEVLEATSEFFFTPYFTLFFQTGDEFISSLRRVKDLIKAVKFYPKGMTTNSDHGVDPGKGDIIPVLKVMEEEGIVLCVHPETPGYYLYRERNFQHYLRHWASHCPRLKIVMEHISDRASLEMLDEIPNLYATITPHHLLFTTDDILGDKLRPHHFCKPTPKTPYDLAALQDLVFRHKSHKHLLGKIMLGTDSAPHDLANKECAHGCAGVFNAPIALQLLAEQFYQNQTTWFFEHFVGLNAQRIYNISPMQDNSAKRIILHRVEETIPNSYGSENETIVPMMAGTKIPWSLKAVQRLS